MFLEQGSCSTGITLVAEPEGPVVQWTTESPEGSEGFGSPVGAAMSTAADDPGEGKGQHIWSLLPRFDPSTGSAREYIEKVKFIDGVCPKKDRSMLATRLDWQCCAEGRPGDKLKLSRRHHWWMGSTG